MKMQERRLIERAIEACGEMQELLHYAMGKLTGPEWDEAEAERFFPLAYEAAKGVSLSLERLDQVSRVLGELRRLYGVEHLEGRGEER
jgi:hypothetical protein